MGTRFGLHPRRCRGVSARALLTSADEADPMNDFGGRASSARFTTARPAHRRRAGAASQHRDRAAAGEGASLGHVGWPGHDPDRAGGGDGRRGQRRRGGRAPVRDGPTGGLLAAVRSSPATAESVSTVDWQWQRGGQVVTCARSRPVEAGGTTGHYGTGDGDLNAAVNDGARRTGDLTGLDRLKTRGAGGPHRPMVHRTSTTTGESELRKGSAPDQARVRHRRRRLLARQGADSVQPRQSAQGRAASGSPCRSWTRISTWTPAR